MIKKYEIRYIDEMMLGKNVIIYKNYNRYRFLLCISQITSIARFLERNIVYDQPTYLNDIASLLFTAQSKRLRQ